MENSNGECRATNATDCGDTVNQLLRVPPLEPQGIFLWFSLLEMQFESARITRDKLKFDALVANLECQYLELVMDIVSDPPATERYERLRSGLIKKLADSSSIRMWKLLEGQKIEDRKPSQFYKDLKRLAGTLISDDLVLMFWKNRLPPSMQRALDVVKEMGANVLTEMADRIHEIWPETGRTAAVSAERTTAVSKQSNRASDTLHDGVSRLEAQTSALTLDSSRSRPCSESHRLQSKERPQQLGLSFCHLTSNNRANQNKAKVICNIEYESNAIYVKDVVSEFSFVVDTGADVCTFPRKYIPGYASRTKDKHFELIAANGTTIATYGTIPVYLNLGCKWQFKWDFVVADVISPLIGLDFLQYHGFLVDTRNKCLLKPTELPTFEVLCHECHCGNDVSRRPNQSTTNFPEFSDPTPPLPTPPLPTPPLPTPLFPTPPAFGRGRIKRDVEHRLNTTFGSLVLMKPGRVDDNPLKQGTAKSQVMMMRGGKRYPLN